MNEQDAREEYNEERRQQAYAEDEDALPPVRSEPLLACCDCEFWSERGEDWASCVANPIPFSTGIPGRFVQTRRDYLCAYGKRKANARREFPAASAGKLHGVVGSLNGGDK